MESTSYAIGISVFSSFLTVVLLLIAKLLWQYWLLEVWLKITCKLVLDVSGTWVGSFQYEGMEVHETLRLTQAGWTLKGTLEYASKEPTQPHPIKKLFEVEGICRGEIVTVYYWNPDRKSRGAGVIAVRLIGDGDKLQGHSAVYEVNSSDISSEAVTYTRLRN